MERRLDRLERREQGLAARCRLLAGRLEGSSLSTSSFSRRREVRDEANDDDDDDAGEEQEEKDDEGEDMGVEDKKRELRLKQMRAKKERLGYVVERLELQAKRREGELRRSVGLGGG